MNTQVRRNMFNKSIKIYYSRHEYLVYLLKIITVEIKNIKDESNRESIPICSKTKSNNDT